MALLDPRRLARLGPLHGKTKSHLARDLGLSPASISQYEAGNTSPRAGVLAEMALVLGVDQRYLEASGNRRQVAPASASFFRSLRATRQWERDAADALSEHLYDVVFFVEARVSVPPSDVPSFPIGAPCIKPRSSRSPLSCVATGKLREGRPIANVVRLMESRGVFVCRPPAVSKRVDAFAGSGARPLVVLCDGKGDKARSRFDAAHELAHLVMRREPEFSDRVQERQAHTFAAAILMPAAEVLDDLPVRPPRGRDWERLEAASDAGCLGRCPALSGEGPWAAFRCGVSSRDDPVQRASLGGPRRRGARNAGGAAPIAGGGTGGDELLPLEYRGFRNRTALHNSTARRHARSARGRLAR